MSISVSSPDGYLFGLLGYLYLLVILIFFCLFLLLHMNHKAVFGIFCVINLVFAITGNFLIYKDILYPRQVDSVLIIKFLTFLEKNSEYPSNIRDTPIAITVHGSTVEGELDNWQNTLRFNGFDNVIFEINNSLDDEPKIIFQTTFNNQIFYLKSFLKSEYTCGKNACEKFIHSNKKFAIIIKN
jgi:hypothetical protein